MPTTLVDADQLEVNLSLRDACYGVRQWDIVSQRTVATARRSGWRPSGIRHRLPIDLRTNDGTVVCRVKRSRALKAMASQYQVLDSDGSIMGTVEREQTKQSDIHQRLLAADGKPLGVFRRVNPGGSQFLSYRYVEPEDGQLRGVELRRTATTSSKQKETWRVSGLSSVPERVRLLVICHQLIIEPWAAGENCTDKTVRDDHY